jgi:hypothetical protein
MPAAHGFMRLRQSMRNEEHRVVNDVGDGVRATFRG